MNENTSMSVQKVQGEIDKVQLIMVNNVDKMMQRGERLELLDSKSTVLSDGATRFQLTARESQRIWIKKRLWLASVLFIGITVFVLFIIVVLSKKDNS